MRRWFCGFLSETDCSLEILPKPLGGKRVWERSNSLWICGEWGKQQTITIYEGSVRLTILGSCLAPHKVLVELFQNAVRKNEYSQLVRLPGSYNLVVQNETDTYIFVDVAGFRPVFYTVYDSFLVYSSLGLALQQLIKAEIDPYWLATSLIGFTSPNLAQNRSPFCRVQAVPPGHYLQVSSGKLMCKQYWNPPQEYCDASSAAEQLRNQLLTSVEGRISLYGNITSDLSGGFDSTSLSLIAAKLLAAREQKLYTVTTKNIGAIESEDVKYAQHAASFYPSIVSVMIEGHEVPVEYSNLEEIPLIDSPDTSILSIGQTSYEMRIIRSKGSQLHMNGEGGDAALLAPYSYLADLLIRAQIGIFIQHAYGWSRVNNLSPVDLISGAVKLSFTSYRQWLLQQGRKLISEQNLSQPFITRVLTDRIMSWDYLRGGARVVSWYTKKLVDLVVEELQKWAAVATPFANTPGQNESISRIHSNAFNAKVRQQLAEAYDVNLEFPYLDSLVIDACLCARPEERTNPFTYKPLLSKALHHDLPKSIFTRTTKGSYIRDRYIGRQQNMSAINTLLQNSLLADMDLIDVREFRATMKQFSIGIDCEWHFDQTLAIELWLRRVVGSSNIFWR